MEKANIRIKKKKLNNQQFMMAMQKLTSTPFDTRTAYAVKKIVDQISYAMKSLRDEYMEKVVKPFAEKNEDGTPKMSDDPRIGFVTPEDKKEEMQKAEDAFGEEEMVLDRWPLAATSLGALKLSAAECEALDGVVDFGEYTEEKAAKLDEAAMAAVFPMAK